MMLMKTAGDDDGSTDEDEVMIWDRTVIINDNQNACIYKG